MPGILTPFAAYAASLYIFLAVAIGLHLLQPAAEGWPLRVLIYDIQVPLRARHLHKGAN